MNVGPMTGAGQDTDVVSASQGLNLCLSRMEVEHSCGMVCRAMPDPEEERSRALTKPSVDCGQPLGLALAAELKCGCLIAGTFRDHLLSDAASIGSSTLNALNVRLNT